MKNLIRMQNLYFSNNPEDFRRVTLHRCQDYRLLLLLRESLGSSKECSLWNWTSLLIPIPQSTAMPQVLQTYSCGSPTLNPCSCQKHDPRDRSGREVWCCCGDWSSGCCLVSNCLGTDLPTMDPTRVISSINLAQICIHPNGLEECLLENGMKSRMIWREKGALGITYIYIYIYGREVGTFTKIWSLLCFMV